MPKPVRSKKPHSSTDDLTTVGGDKENDNIGRSLYYNAQSGPATKSDYSSSADTDNENISNNNTDTFLVNDDILQNDDEPILRAKKQPPRVTKTDEEVYAELQMICNLSDPLKKYSKTKEVGKGASGVVFIASNLQTQQQVAIKTMDLKNQSSKELILNEIRVLKDFNHKNLVNFLEAYYLEQSDNLWVVLEYMNG